MSSWIQRGATVASALMMAMLLPVACVTAQGLGVVGDVYTYPDGSNVIMVQSVLPGGVARRLGVQPRDVIASINGMPPGDAATNQRAIAAGRGRVALEVVRGGTRRVLQDRASASRPAIPTNPLIPSNPVPTSPVPASPFPTTPFPTNPAGPPSGIGTPRPANPGGGNAGLAPQKLNATQSAEAARYVIEHWMNQNRSAQIEQRLRQLFASRPASDAAIRRDIVPYYTDYITRYYRNSSRTRKVLLAIDILRGCGADARIASTTLEAIGQGGGELAAAARQALASIQSVTIDAELVDIERATRTLVLRSRQQGIIRVRVPPTVQVSNAALNSRFLTVTYNGSSLEAIRVIPASFGSQGFP